MTLRLEGVRRWATAGLACGLLLAASPAFSALVINKNAGTQSDIPGLTGFSTSGDEMVGMSVTAVFTNFSETLFWAATGPGAGGVTGAGWGLSVSGDTFSANWQFTIGPNLGQQLVSFELSGNSGLTVFDTTNPSFGTDGSAQGADFAFTGGYVPPPGDENVIADYTDIVAVIPNAPVGDLYHVLSVTFGNIGPRASFTFRQDTDNDSRLLRVPEPGSLALLGLALAGLGFARRRATR